MIGRILGSVDESLVEHESLSFAPNAFHAIDQDAASFRFGVTNPFDGIGVLKVTIGKDE